MAKSRSRLWFNLLFPLACFYVFAYPPWRLTDWWTAGSGIGWIGALTIWLLGLFGMYYAFGGPRMYIRYVVVHWMGVSFVFSTLVLLSEPIRWLGVLEDSNLAQVVAAAGAALCLGAVVLSHHLAVKHHKIPTAKLGRSYRIAQISDVHIGSRQNGFMDRIVRRINSLNPDYIVITGDLIDSSAVELDALAPLSRLRSPVFFCIGNHERYADLPKMLDMARNLGIQTLQQRVVDAGDLVFLGIDDDDRQSGNLPVNPIPAIVTIFSWGIWSFSRVL